MEENKIIILETKDKEVCCNFFLDSEKGVLVDTSNCKDSEKFMLLDLRFLCDNVTKIEKKENCYFINNKKYLDSAKFETYMNKTFKELSNVIKGRKYVTMKHIGSYDLRHETYEKILNYIKENNYKINGIPREEYIEGRWNNVSEDNYLTNIMIPVVE